MAPRFLNGYTDWYIGGERFARLNTRPRAEGYPRTAVKRVAAGRSSPDYDEPVVDETASRIGEGRGARASRGKSLTFELQQQALTEIDMNISIEELQAAFADHSSIGLLVVTPWPGHGDDIWAAFAQIDDFDCDEQLVYPVDDYPAWRLDPILVARMLDGRWFWLNESGTWPDDPQTPMAWESNPGDAVLVTNNGTAPTEPTITVFGVDAGDDVHVGRDLPGGGSVDLWFRNPVGKAGVGSGDLVIDFTSNPRRATVGPVDISGTYDAGASSWWDAFAQGIPGRKPGAAAVPVNVWRGPGAGVGIRVHFYSTSW